MDTVVLFAKSKTLAQLAEEITTTEQAVGPLIALGSNSEKTAATFKPGRRPKSDLEIAEVKPPSATKVCQGKIWSANVRLDAVAYRMP